MADRYNCQRTLFKATYVPTKLPAQQASSDGQQPASACGQQSAAPAPAGVMAKVALVRGLNTRPPEFCRPDAAQATNRADGMAIEPCGLAASTTLCVPAVIPLATGCHVTPAPRRPRLCREQFNDVRECWPAWRSDRQRHSRRRRAAGVGSVTGRDSSSRSSVYSHAASTLFRFDILG